MATANSAISFQGVSSGVQTDALIQAILAQKGTGLARLQTQQTNNNNRTSALTAMKSSMNTLSLSLVSLVDKFNARTVTSTDANNTYVTATAVGAAVGSYDLKVSSVATKARISPTFNFSGTSTNAAALTFNSATAKTITGAVGFTIDGTSTPGGAVSGTFTFGGASYALTGTNGTLTGAAGTPLEGLSVTVNGAGSGTLNLTATPTNLAVADPTKSISTAPATFAIQGTDGVVKTFQLNNDSLNGLRDAINASGANVTASVVNTGTGATPYQLVVTAKDTGTGSTNGVITLADMTGGGAVNSLGIPAGIQTVNTAPAPDTLTGLSSSASGTTASDAVFTVNGIQLTRKSNVVTDAADGVTFTLKQGGQTGTTSLTVVQDKTTATAGMQDVLTKYNLLVTGYKTASAITQNADGSVTKAPLAGDAATRAIMSKIKLSLTSVSAGLPSTAAYQNLGSLGVKTAADGTLSLDTTAFQNALDKDPAAVKRLFSFSGDSDNGVVSVSSAGAKTATGTVNFTISKDAGTGVLTGNFTGTANGTAFNIDMTASNGVMVGAIGTALEGLNLAVTGPGSGIMTLSRGAGQAASDLITSLTSSSTGSIASTLLSIQTQNRSLALQIDSAQSALDKQKINLQRQFAHMEVIVGQLHAGATSLNNL